MKIAFCIGFFLLFFIKITAQDVHRSIHSEQQNYYSQFGEREACFYDSLNGFKGPAAMVGRSNCQIQKVVFGFHPYWAGSDYLDYQWNLLSDLSYFSYEVDPSTGGPMTYHGWLTDPAIDSAKIHGVRVHLCATLFSGHHEFFSSPGSRQTLINSLISLVQQRGADGINMDIEALPSTLGDSVTSFIRDLSMQLKTALPGTILSIDLPAVDWSNSFDIIGLDPFIDYFFVMGYDYYWDGSAEAGPVSPLYSLTSGYDYNLSRTISAYESSGMSKGKFILGVPYYGRQWITQSNSIPSATIGNGTALTYYNIRSNTGTYNSENYQWEQNSFSSCYIFFRNDNWNQCFMGLDRDLRKKYDIVNYRGLAGIGIWALGYDNGFPELWQAISDKFSDCFVPLSYDSIYDSGGPAWNYYPGESYITTIDQGFNDTRWLSFTEFSLEEGYDSLWVFAGPDTTSPLLGGFTGSSNPGNFTSPGGAFTLKFKSDHLQNAPGWMAIYHDGSIGVKEIHTEYESSLNIYPNPASDQINIRIPSGAGKATLSFIDISGKTLINREIKGNGEFNQYFQLDVSDFPGGIYSAVLTGDSGKISQSGIFVVHR